MVDITADTTKPVAQRHRMQHPPGRFPAPQPGPPVHLSQLGEDRRDRNLAIRADPPRPVRTQPLDLTAASRLMADPDTRCIRRKIHPPRTFVRTAHSHAGHRAPPPQLCGVECRRTLEHLAAPTRDRPHSRAARPPACLATCEGPRPEGCLRGRAEGASTGHGPGSALAPTSTGFRGLAPCLARPSGPVGPYPLGGGAFSPAAARRPRTAVEAHRQGRTAGPSRSDAQRP
jgi:hypothetical protein